ncbi:MBL fold metallo-hydrolase [Craterilacuibacter sp. RT1T]|uniref:MBL fold metallo-hydrolase RNA specificity domain-containing protein n=1 Tax=Craterilacuibacter sp. RT1T TaxID=2942211 RepID=UPI0020C009DC|nr:MBL fold metallo-hydrolase [Craterilacuibacter sp. RT1T]MCL6262972.1 MBL fold metallo-hydrolase [Craterilacuibacter sp. RT1T]
MKITFLGAAGTVTGSKTLIEHDGHRVLVDCGLFQGFKQLRLRNWQPFEVQPSTIDAVVLTHAHLDHSGYLPALVRDGFHGAIHTTPASVKLAAILLADSGRLQEEEAEFANRRGYSKHHPALALYTEADAQRVDEHFQPLALGEAREIAPGFVLTLRQAGHILGAAMAELSVDGKTLLFSGDLGRPNDPITFKPDTVSQCDILFVESTYGNRHHPQQDTGALLADVVSRTVHRGGVVVIPSFAVERAQTLLLLLYRLKQARRIPDVPVYLNSPMAGAVTTLFHEFHEELRLSEAEVESMCRGVHFVRTVEESKALNRSTRPAVIIAGSGMATGGRVLHHIAAFGPDQKNTLLFAGFQAGGTRGALIVAGANSVRMFGEDVPIRAEVVALEHLSAHADGDEILAWLSAFSAPPMRTFVMHGEPEAADTLRRNIEHRYGWRVEVPEHKQSIVL